jgi:hypothetical protein
MEDRQIGLPVLGVEPRLRIPTADEAAVDAVVGGHWFGQLGTDGFATGAVDPPQRAGPLEHAGFGLA